MYTGLSWLVPSQAQNKIGLVRQSETHAQHTEIHIKPCVLGLAQIRADYIERE
jgi:hypothetical protein